MTESKLVDGTPMYVVRTEMYVRKITFIKALSEHFYNRNEEFDKKLTKKEGMKILKRGLFFFGVNGELEDGYFEASFEQGEIWNAIESAATEWVSNNYPYLTSKNP